MKLAFMYAGQGAQKVGMGKDFYEEYDEFKNCIDNCCLDFDIKETMFEDSDGKINITRYTQPCMAAFAAGVTDILKKEGITPDVCAGLSLGEYSALYCAGVFSTNQFIDLVAFRGKVMDEAAKGIECKMSAVLGMESDVLSKLCDKVCEEDPSMYVTVSNYNCKGQYVVCGDEKAVEKVEALAKENGAKRCLPLKVSGPFHTKFMESASIALKDKFESIEIDIDGKVMNLSDVKSVNLLCPVVFNTTAKELADDENIAALLEKQVKSSIYMEDTIKYLKNQGVTTVVEIGPGKVISGFIKKTEPDIISYNVETVQDLKKIIEVLKEA